MLKPVEANEVAKIDESDAALIEQINKQKKEIEEEVS